jgi:hypothetical protein
MSTYWDGIKPNQNDLQAAQALDNDYNSFESETTTIHSSLVKQPSQKIEDLKSKFTAPIIRREYFGNDVIDNVNNQNGEADNTNTEIKDNHDSQFQNLDTINQTHDTLFKKASLFKSEHYQQNLKHKSNLFHKIKSALSFSGAKRINNAQTNIHHNSASIKYFDHTNYLIYAGLGFALIMTSVFSYWQIQQTAFKSSDISEASGNSQGSIIRTSYGLEVNKQDYGKWILAKNNNNYSEPETDLDQDELDNVEEFLLDTNPNLNKSCNENTDIQNLVNLVDPATCVKIDLNQEETLVKYQKVINIPKISEAFNKDLTEQKSEQTPANIADEKTNNNSLSGIFGVDNLNDISKITKDTLDKNLQEKAEQNEERVKYLKLIEKTNTYMNTYRSWMRGDRDVKIPVNATKYVDISIRYNVELKYVLALARIESQFGTNQFNDDGTLNRIGKHKNIYSIGLDDSGNNLTFASWEEGVEGFGKWYKKFNDRGVKDCQKWRIYNPNGDACQRVESMAKEIEAYLK